MSQANRGRMFLQSCRDFVELEPFRGTSFIGAAKLSPVTKLFASIGAVSRYKLYRSQRIITVQELGCEQMSVSGCRAIRNLSRCRGKAKTVTNLFTLLTVLGGRSNFKSR